MCPPKDFMKHVDYILMNKIMKEHLSSPPPPESGVLFYRQNQFNKPLAFPIQQRNKCVRPGKCFPSTAPPGLSVYRTVFATRPRAEDDVQLPSRNNLYQNYTLKIDKKFLKKN